MKNNLFERLSGRERQLMDIIYRLGEATVSEVREAMSDPPSYSSVRALLGILEDKGLVLHERRSRTYLYSPTVSPERARGTALSHIVKTFFDGSVEKAVSALLDSSTAKMSEEQLTRLEKLIREKIKGRELK